MRRLRRSPAWARWWRRHSPTDTVVLITADHGNLETMTVRTATPHVAHTTNPVEFILIDPRSSFGP